MATTISLLRKEISGNRYTLYLDFYPPIPTKDGKTTRREFLKIHVPKPIRIKQKKERYGIRETPVFADDVMMNRILEQQYKDGYEQAEAIKNTRTRLLNGSSDLTALERKQLKIITEAEQKKERLETTNFVEYFKAISEDKPRAGTISNRGIWASAHIHLHKFTKGKLPFSEVTEAWLEKFQTYLLTKIDVKHNTAAGYFRKVKAAINKAIRDEYITKPMFGKDIYIKERRVIKNTLTYEERELLAKTPFDDAKAKRIILFSAFTGMPFADIKELTWSNIETVKGFTYMKKLRKKTATDYIHTFENGAEKYLGKRGVPEENVFPEIKNKRTAPNDSLRLFLATAGIKKKITFHDLRHSYCQIRIDAGEDLYQTSKQMGHLTIKQTERYAPRAKPITKK